MKRGGKLLGQGTYGCVFDKPFHCMKEKKIQSGVAKVMITKQDADDEYSEQMLLSKIDLQERFTNPILDKCTITYNEIMTDTDYKNCRIMRSGSKEYEQLIYKHSGYDLSTYKSVFNKNILEGFVNILTGLITLQKHQIVHRDIKPPNILMVSSKMLLIDFGIMTNYENVYNMELSGFTLESNYLYNPPEYQYYVLVFKKLYSGRQNVVAQNPFRRFSDYGQGYMQLIHQLSKCTKLTNKHYINMFSVQMSLFVETINQQLSTLKTLNVQVLKTVFDKFCDKVDVFAMGVSMLQVFGQMDTSKLSKRNVNKFISIILRSIDFNMFTRIDTKSFLQEIKAFSSLKVFVDKTVNQIRFDASPTIYHTPNTKSRRNSLNSIHSSILQNCMDKYSLAELKLFIKNKKEFKGLSQLKKENLCAIIAYNLDNRDSTKTIKRGRPKKLKVTV